MDQNRKRARDAEAEAAAAAMRRQMQLLQEQEAVAAEVAEALESRCGGFGEDEPWQRPPGVFEMPWQNCRGGLGVPPPPGGWWDIRDVFFRSLVDGRAATLGVPGDRVSPPPGKRTLFDDVDAWLAGAGADEVDPLWRSVLEGAPPKPKAGPAA